MKSFLYYFDKLTSWLDFSWLITIPQKNHYTKLCNDSPPYIEPLLMN